MAIEIKVPVLPESVADAVLLDWNKQPGDAVSRDEILVEVETDKVVLEVPAPSDGVLTEILQQSGAIVLAEQVLATMEEGEGAAPAPDAAPAGDAASDAAPAEPAPAPVADAAPAPAEPAPAPAMGPAARRLVQEAGLDPVRIPGTGKDGRITKQDVVKYMADGESAAPAAQPAPAAPDVSPAPAASAPAPAPSAAAGERREIREPMSRLRRTIADRLVHSQQTAALLTTFNEVDMQPVMTLRSRYREEFENRHGVRLGFMSFFVKASVAALQRFPLVNAYIDGDDIVQHSYNDIGIAVASPRGLVVPVLRDCQSLPFAEIESRIRDFGERARDGKVGMDELTGGTFTITNGGVFGSLVSTPIINPPQSAILGMHKIQDRPMARDGEVVIRPMMYLALSYDHRIIDGSEAVRFLVTIKDALEDPARLLLDC